MGQNKPISLIETMHEPQKYRISRLGNYTWLSLVFWKRAKLAKKYISFFKKVFEPNMALVMFI